VYCPTCGLNNLPERKFCTSCGTNLEAVTQALNEKPEGALASLDGAMDKLIARYAENAFEDATKNALEWRVSNSWKILGQGLLTVIIDYMLFTLMMIVLPIRLFLLLITTPYRLICEKGGPGRVKTSELAGRGEPGLSESLHGRWIGGQVASITENTTNRLPEHLQKIEPPGPEE